jgi:replication-associated recombination protein RarA
MMIHRIPTKRGYSFPAVSSAMQKAIRRGDAKLAGYWALELWASGYGQYVWRRLLTVSAEDCWGRNAETVQVTTTTATARSATGDIVTTNPSPPPRHRFKKA